MKVRAKGAKEARRKMRLRIEVTIKATFLHLLGPQAVERPGGKESRESPNTSAKSVPELDPFNGFWRGLQ